LPGNCICFCFFVSLYVVGIITFSLIRLSLTFFLLTDFFLKHAVAVMTVRELFEFVTDPSITDKNMDAYLSKVRWGEDRVENSSVIVICICVILLRDSE
jgi:hypothetical protein